MRSLLLCFGMAALAAAVDTTNLMWNLVQGPEYMWPQEQDISVPLPTGNVTDADWQGIAFAGMEVFQTLFNRTSPATSTSASMRTFYDPPWTQGHYFVYGAMYVTADVQVPPPMPWLSGGQDTSLADYVRYRIAVNRWDSGFATLRDNAANDGVDYGYASYKVSAISENDFDRDNYGRALPAIPPTIDSLPQGVMKMEYVALNLSLPHDYDGAQTPHT